jgi:hypothetical protein
VNPFWSALLGVGIGLLYGAMAYLAQRIAVRQEGSRFLGVLVGGMLLRMVVLLVLVGVVLALVPVQAMAFVIPLVVTLLASLGLDAWWLMRWMRRTPGQERMPRDAS